MKEKFNAVKASWRVDFSTPYISLNALENDFAEISFGADFGRHMKGNNSQEDSQAIDFEEVSIVEYPNSLILENYSQYQYQRVKVKFDTFYSIKMSPSYSSLCVINDKNYDWGSVMFFDLISQDLEIWSEKFYTYWKEANVCPDPRMYEVENSKWLENEARAVRLGCKHFIILGHDSYIEILAKNWDWVSLGGLSNW